MKLKNRNKYINKNIMIKSKKKEEDYNNIQ